MIVKHANPCGVAVAATIEEAYAKALACDPVSAYGGVVALNRKVARELARALAGAVRRGADRARLRRRRRSRRSRSKQALRILRDRERRGASPGERDYRRVLGGLPRPGHRRRGRRPRGHGGRDRGAARRGGAGATSSSPGGWRKHVASNAIVVAKDLQTIGIGAGQMSRVDAVRLALEKAREHGHDLSGAALASDAFFPFPDGPQLALDAGVTAIIQPGGSKRDDEVVAAVDGGRARRWSSASRRHFRH